MSGPELEGRILSEQAEQKLKGFFTMFGGEQKYRDSAELFEKSANCFKTAKKWDDAGRAFVRAAEVISKCKDSTHDAAQYYVSAGTCLKKTNGAEAVKYLGEAAQLLQDAGRFSMAAKLYKDMGETCEADMDFEGAMKMYQTAADLFEGEDSTSSTNACLLKVAQFAAQQKDYPKAIEIYEKIAKNSVGNNLLQYSVKDYFLRAGLCHLASGDAIGSQRAIQRYKDMQVSFETQRECVFLTTICDALDKSDLEAFTNAVVEYDSITKLDAWKTSVLLAIKDHIKAATGASDGPVDLT